MRPKKEIEDELNELKDEYDTLNEAVETGVVDGWEYDGDLEGMWNRIQQLKWVLNNDDNLDLIN